MRYKSIFILEFKTDKPTIIQALIEKAIQEALANNLIEEHFLINTKSFDLTLKEHQLNSMVGQQTKVFLKGEIEPFLEGYLMQDEEYYGVADLFFALPEVESIDSEGIRLKNNYLRNSKS